MMMNVNLVNALRTKSAYLPGGRDRDGNLLLVIVVPSQLDPKSKENFELCVSFILDALSHETLISGLTILVDGQKSSWRLTKAWLAHVKSLIDVDYLKNVIIIRSDAFWDKQRVESCTKSKKLGEVTIIPRSRLLKYVDSSELPEELGGTFSYSHDQWIQNHVRIQVFKNAHGKAVTLLEELQTLLIQNQTTMLRARDIEQATKICTIRTNDVQRLVKFVMDMGNRLINEINDLQYSPLHASANGSNGRCSSSSSSGASGSGITFTSQDLLDAREMVKYNLNEIESRQVLNNAAWDVLELKAADLREVAKLEDGVQSVVNWILSQGEQMMNENLSIAYDVASSQRLRFEHEMMELKCCSTYGKYAELRHRIDQLRKQGEAVDDLRSQRQYMETLCRSFASRMEFRRNTLITCGKFFKMVTTYFDGTSKTYETLIMGPGIDDPIDAEGKLTKLLESEKALEMIQRRAIEQGDKLIEMLSLSIKTVLGAPVAIDYSGDISNIRDILEATISRRNIFNDSLELQKVTLKQITYIHTYEKEAAMATDWIISLFQVMIHKNVNVGCTGTEIQRQKDEHQDFLDTAKLTFNYIIQLLQAAITLRHKCKLSIDKAIATNEQVQITWKNFQKISQEQMTRLRVSAVFHRNVDEQVDKVKELKQDLSALYTTDDTKTRKQKMRRLQMNRERLFAEIGRMIRLGRLLKTRLKEPFVLERNGLMSEETVEPDNSIASDTISSRLIDVADMVENLEKLFKETQTDLCLSDPESSDSASEKRQPNDDWNSSVKSTEDDSYITASEGHHHSRSSSFHTASECAHSPWWGESIERNSLDADSLDQELPTMELLSGVISSANVSFDDTEQTFNSPEPSAETDTIMPSLIMMPPPLPGRKSSHDSQADSNFEEDSKSASSLDVLERVDSQSDSACSVDKHSPSSISGEDLIEVRTGYEQTTLKEGLSYYYQNIITTQSLKTCL